MRTNKKTSSQLAGLADCIRSLAKYHVRVDPETLKRIEQVRSRLTHEATGLTDKNRERLRQFDDQRNVSKLLWAGKTAFTQAVKRDDGTRQIAHEASLALALELLLHAPMRIANLASLRLDRHLHWEKSGCSGVLSIAIPGQEVKNGEPLNFPFPLPVSNMVRQYLEVFRPRLFKGSNEYLFPSRDGKAKRSDTLGKQISKQIWDNCGLRVNPHLIRHFVAKQIVEATPGNYEGARRILAHKDSNTTYKFYEGMEAKPAFEYWQNILMNKRGHTEPTDGGGLRDTRVMRRSAHPKRRLA
jgi:integrase